MVVPDATSSVSNSLISSMRSSIVDVVLGAECHRHEDVFVVGAGEHSQLAGAGDLAADPLEEVLLLLLLGRLRERSGTDTGRIHRDRDVFDGPVLAAAVEALEDEEHLAIRFGEDEFVGVEELFVHLVLEFVLGVVLVVHERCLGRVVAGEVDVAVDGAGAELGRERGEVEGHESLSGLVDGDGLVLHGELQAFGGFAVLAVEFVRAWFVVLDDDV